MRPRLLLCALLLFSLPLPAAEVPFLSGRVNDLAELLSPETVRYLEGVLKAHEDSTSNQLAVLTITSLEGEEIEPYALRVAETWGLGQKGKDNGVLLLIVRDERKVRIEVGRGLEGDLPDITCGQIIRHQIIPHFKDGDYDGGTRAGVEAILAAIAGSYVAEEHQEDNFFITLIASLIFLVVVGTFTMLVLFQKGFVSWFLYVFLLPFWAAFPYALYGKTVGMAALGLYAVLVPLAKLWFKYSPAGGSVWQKWGSATGFSSRGAFHGGSSGSSGGGFSGGGGGFSGGGASGSW